MDSPDYAYAYGGLRTAVELFLDGLISRESLCGQCERIERELRAAGPSDPS